MVERPIDNVLAPSITNNSYSDPPFDLRLIPTYTNNQLRRYYISRVMLDVDKTELKKQMDERKATLELID
jgi:hypothetical protein